MNSWSWAEIGVQIWSKLRQLWTKSWSPVLQRRGITVSQTIAPLAPLACCERYLMSMGLTACMLVIIVVFWMECLSQLLHVFLHMAVPANGTTCVSPSYSFAMHLSSICESVRSRCTKRQSAFLSKSYSKISLTFMHPEVAAPMHSVESLAILWWARYQRSCWPEARCLFQLSWMIFQIGGLSDYQTIKLSPCFKGCNSSAKRFQVALHCLQNLQSLLVQNHLCSQTAVAWR